MSLIVEKLIIYSSLTLGCCYALDTTMRHNLFVYGTLRRGFYNYDVYLQHAVENGQAQYVGMATTTSPFALKLRGDRQIPALLEQTHNTVPIRGEVYTISDSVLQAMDLLEGVARGFYYRSSRSVRLDDKKNEKQCWIYLQEGEENNDPCYSEYTAELHARYIPPAAEPDLEILKLLLLKR